jgi:hypothetical protein
MVQVKKKKKKSVTAPVSPVLPKQLFVPFLLGGGSVPILNIRFGCEPPVFWSQE